MRSSSGSCLPVDQGLKENPLVYRGGWRITPWRHGTVNGILAKAPYEGGQGESFFVAGLKRRASASVPASRTGLGDFPVYLKSPVKSFRAGFCSDSWMVCPRVCYKVA